MKHKKHRKRKIPKKVLAAWRKKKIENGEWIELDEYLKRKAIEEMQPLIEIVCPMD